MPVSSSVNPSPMIGTEGNENDSSANQMKAPPLRRQQPRGTHHLPPLTQNAKLGRKTNPKNNFMRVNPGPPPKPPLQTNNGNNHGNNGTSGAAAAAAAIIAKAESGDLPPHLTRVAEALFPSSLKKQTTATLRTTIATTATLTDEERNKEQGESKQQENNPEDEGLLVGVENGGEETQVNEIRIGYMVLAKALTTAYWSVMRRTFGRWALLYASRFNAARFARPNMAATDIQRWYRNVRQTSRQSWKNLSHAIQMCLHRRKAIKAMIQFEMQRRKALIKIHKGIALRRRFHFTTRSMQRVTRWKFLLRKTSHRLIRSIAARKIQRWRRMFAFRTAREKMIIALCLRCGGYSVILPKIPAKHIVRGFIDGVEACISQIQRGWFASKGNLALYYLFAARRARAAYEAMLNENATIIQNSFRALLWYRLMMAAITNNRARRIQRAYRSYQYRYWVWYATVRFRNRKIKPIQRMVRRFLYRILLRKRFKLRKALLIFTRAKKTISAMYIQRAYRAHVIRERIKKEELRKFYAQQRQQGEKVLENVSKIQRTWRKNKNDGKYFPKHVKQIIQRIIRRQNLKYYLGAFFVQRLVRKKLEQKRLALAKKRLKAANVIWFFAKSYLLRLAMWDRVLALRLRKRRAVNLMKKNFRIFLFRAQLRIRCAIRKSKTEYASLVYNAVFFIQDFVRRKIYQYYTALRVAGRKQLAKRRIKEEEDRKMRRDTKSARFITRFFKSITGWSKTVKKIADIRKKIKRFNLERKSAWCLQKFCRYVVRWAFFNRKRLERLARLEAEELRRRHTIAAGVIGFFWRRNREIKELQVRFKLRRAMLDIYHDLREKKIKADKDRDDAIEDKRITDENMAATIAASWKLGSDVAGRNYYYNYVTGESSWQPPENWKARVLDTWVRNVDERGNVYYYNMANGESNWLPPCAVCGLESQRWCADCDVAYCEDHFEVNHGPDADESMAEHTWSLVEYERDVLKAGEVYCIDCKRRTASKMCTTCWDPYCDDCFKYAHHAGHLKAHKAVNYKRAKAGWTCVKGKGEDPDYYINGLTGKTTYEKPEELMSPAELVYYQNFLSHKAKAEEHIRTIEKLQYDLEAACFERDTVIFDALNGGGNIGAILAKRQQGKIKKPKRGEVVLDKQADVVGQAVRNNSMPMGFFERLFSGKDQEHRNNMLAPDDRRRGKAQSEFVKSIIDDVEHELKHGSKEKKK